MMPGARRPVPAADEEGQDVMSSSEGRTLKQLDKLHRQALTQTVAGGGAKR